MFILVARTRLPPRLRGRLLLKQILCCQEEERSWALYKEERWRKILSRNDNFSKLEHHQPLAKKTSSYPSRMLLLWLQKIVRLGTRIVDLMLDLMIRATNNQPLCFYVETKAGTHYYTTSALTKRLDKNRYIITLRNVDCSATMSFTESS